MTSTTAPLLRRAATAALIASGLACAATAHAAIDSPVSISLVAPGGIIGTPGAIDITDSVSTASGITVGDTTGIGQNYMLPGEFIHFSGNSILLHVDGGTTNANGTWVTGYLGQGANRASYVFNNVSIGGAAIASLVESHTGAVTGGISVSLTGPKQITFNLDALTFSAPNLAVTPYPSADFTLALTAAPVPEPGTTALMLAGLAAVAVGVRARRC